MKQTIVLRTNHDRERFIDRLDKAKLPLRIDVDVARGTKTEAQLGYLFGVAYPSIQSHIRDVRGLWFSCEDIHEELITKLEPMEVKQGIDGREHARRTSLAKLSVSRTADYIDKLLAYCASELHLIIEEPV